jgi:hypothetical protein
MQQDDKFIIMKNAVYCAEIELGSGIEGYKAIRLKEM